MVVDGNSIINRAFFGLPLLTNSEGTYTNAVYGFLNILFKFLEEDRPTYIGVAFDLKAPTFRHEQYKEYKGNRKGMPEELRPQVGLLKEVLDAMGIARFEMEGYEADDLLGTIAKKSEEKGMEVVIVTGDRDALQLATEHVKIRIPKTKKGGTEVEDYFATDVQNAYGVTPRAFIDVKGLMGDPSDNIPGVPGIGEKTAIKIIQQYGSIENALEHISEMKGKKVQEGLFNYKEQAIMSKELATILTEVPIEIPFERMQLGDVFTEAAYGYFKRLEFKSLLSKFQTIQVQPFNVDKGMEDIGGVCVEEEKEFQVLLKKLEDEKEMVILLESEGQEILGISVASKNMEAAYIYFNENLKKQFVLDQLKPIFEDENIKKIAHNGKKDILLFQAHGITYRGLYFDIMIAGYILNPTKENYNFDELSKDYLNEMIPSEEERFGKGKSKKHICDLQKEDRSCFGTRHAQIALRVKEIMEESIIKNQQQQLFYEIEMPLVETLASMESIGIKVDKEELQRFSIELGEKIQGLEIEIFTLAETNFNINSPKQLGEVLFEKLQLPVIKKTKTGYSTAADVLEQLQKQHPIVDKILEYRQLVKLKSTYADGLFHVISEKTQKIHSNFNQTITATGRISSTEPNLQNIPIKLELGRRIRKVFIPSNEEYLLLDVDYSQIELRVLADISEDENLINAFKNNQDIHRLTASQVFKIPFEEVTSLQRSNAKAVNFGIIYGMGAFSLSKDLGITKKEAERYIEGYFEKYPKVKEYMHNVIEQGKKAGYVSTLFNRKRSIPELNSSNFMVRSGAERIAMNTPIQGTAADIIKIAMNNVYRELKKGGYKSRLILQVHDELLIEIHKDELDTVKVLVETQMENAVKLKVPMMAEGHIGQNWYETK